MKIAVKLSVFLVVITMVLAAYAVQSYRTDVSQPLGIEASTLFEVKAGDSVQKVTRSLIDVAQADISSLFLKLWLKFEFKGGSIQTGFYQLTPEMTLNDALELMVRGEQKQFSVSLVEGLTWKQWLSALRTAPNLVDDWNNTTEQRLLEKFSAELGQSLVSLEGVLLADTYFYVANSSISALIERAFSAMQTALSNRFDQQPMPEQMTDIYDVLILASIVEKETAVDSERPLIAGVFTQRLKKNMRLQTDPTIIYGLGDEFKGDITREHLKRPTPYNTYVIKGLPPTPIAMVGTAAIDAVIDAEATPYLYFVAKGDGTHYFSISLKEHNKAVRQYQLGKN